MENLPHGLLHSSLLDGNGGLKPFEPGALSEWEMEHGHLWLHFDFTAPEAVDWIRNHSGLDEVVQEALLMVESRPRATRVGNGVLVAFRGVNLHPGAAPDDMVGIRLWVEEHRIVSTVRRKLMSVDDVVESLVGDDGKHCDGPEGAPEVLVELASKLVARMSDTVDELEDQIAELEEMVLEGDTQREARYCLAKLRRQVIALRRYLGPQREALSSLVASKVPWMLEEHRADLRETADRLMQHLENLDAVRERAAVTQEEVQSRLAEQQNIRMYVLSIVSAVFLPLGFLTGLLGINVGGIPGADNPMSFWIFLGFLVVLVGAQMVWFRFRKWF